MRKLVIPVFAICLFMMTWTTGCTDRKTETDDSTFVDSTSTDTIVEDTMDQLIAEQQMPKAADELFDDFIFNFAANRKLQVNRIKFPLKFVDGDNTSYVEKSAWKMDYFFMEQGYYTLILDNERQMKAVKDTSVNNVVVEKIYLDNNKVKRYYFERLGGQWMLTSMSQSPIAQNSEASFLSFYQRFVTDSVFQVNSLNDPVMFSGPDPDDDFETMSGEIDPETWPAFAPELPSGLIYNINYGQKSGNGNQKIFVMRGIANGMEMQLTFSNVGGKWKLTKFSE